MGGVLLERTSAGASVRSTSGPAGVSPRHGRPPDEAAAARRAVANHSAVEWRRGTPHDGRPHPPTTYPNPPSLLGASSLRSPTWRAYAPYLEVAFSDRTCSATHLVPILAHIDHPANPHPVVSGSDLVERRRHESAPAARLPGRSSLTSITNCAAASRGARGTYKSTGWGLRSGLRNRCLFATIVVLSPSCASVRAPAFCNVAEADFVEAQVAVVVVLRRPSSAKSLGGNDLGATLGEDRVRRRGDRRHGASGSRR